MRMADRQKFWRAFCGLVLCLVIGFGLLAYQVYPDSKATVFETGRTIVQLMRKRMPDAGDPVVQDLYKKLPRVVVGKTYFGAVKGCVDLEYVELAFLPFRDQRDGDADTKSEEIFDLFVGEGKCINETSLKYPYKVLAIQEHFMVLGDEHALGHDKTTLGIVKIEVHAPGWFDIPKVLYMTVFFPGVRT